MIKYHRFPTNKYSTFSSSYSTSFLFMDTQYSTLYCIVFWLPLQYHQWKNESVHFLAYSDFNTHIDQPDIVLIGRKLVRPNFLLQLRGIGALWGGKVVNRGVCVSAGRTRNSVVLMQNTGNRGRECHTVGSLPTLVDKDGGKIVLQNGNRVE